MVGGRLLYYRRILTAAIARWGEIFTSLVGIQIRRLVSLPMFFLNFSL